MKSRLVVRSNNMFTPGSLVVRLESPHVILVTGKGNRPTTFSGTCVGSRFPYTKTDFARSQYRPFTGALLLTNEV